MTSVLFSISWVNKFCLLIFTCRSVDPSDSLSLSGVRTFISADDVPGSNLTGYYVRDEEIFATNEVRTKRMPCCTFGKPVSVITYK